MTSFVQARLLFLTCAAIGAAALAPKPAHADEILLNQGVVPPLLSQEERQYYREVHEAIERKDWSRVQELFSQQPDGPLHQHARAEYYLAAGSPRIELPDLEAWLNQGTALPRSEQIGRLAAKRGANYLPPMPEEQAFRRLPPTPKRVRPAPVDDGTMPENVSSGILERIKNDDPAGAQQLLDGIDALLSNATRAEWRQRVAWSYYIENQDEAAYRMAQMATLGSGPWVAEAWWTTGLAAWRLGDCDAAADSFYRAAGLAENPELSAAAFYWQSRALVRCRKPEKAADALRGAARDDETFYGMLAAEQLGMKLPDEPAETELTREDWGRLSNLVNVRVAIGLTEIDEDDLADEVLRHQARIGSASQFEPLSRLAREIGLPRTQLWMSYNAPYGAKPEPSTRYPVPKWQPITGWRVDPDLVFAHALQESQFRASVVSPAGARGLMQIMPVTARQHAAAIGVSGSTIDLNNPEVNLAFGQRHLELLRDSSVTRGLLPKVMAAYNAGLTPVARWNTEVRDQGDPLLWIESIPYWETRGYVNIVMRNYWMYERRTGDPSQSRLALAQGMWPTFPGLSGGRGVRVSANGVTYSGN